jgi:hypothetical protein
LRQPGVLRPTFPRFIFAAVIPAQVFVQFPYPGAGGIRAVGEFSMSRTIRQLFVGATRAARPTCSTLKCSLSVPFSRILDIPVAVC